MELFLSLWRCGPKRVMATSFLRFLDHTQRRITFGRIPLDEWSARRGDLYLTTHNTHNRQTSMPPGGIRTQVLSRRAAADLRLRPRGHWDRPSLRIIASKWKLIACSRVIVHISKNVCVLHIQSNTTIFHLAVQWVYNYMFRPYMWAIFRFWFNLQSSYTRCVECSFRVLVFGWGEWDLVFQ